MKLYKLTDENGKTRNNTQWGENVTHIAEGNNVTLCTNGVIHAYVDPILAMMMNTAHSNFMSPQLWEAEGDIVVDNGTKVGCKSLTTTKQIECPKVSLIQKIKFRILCAKQVYKKEGWNVWADNWLNGNDRTKKAAAAAYDAAYDAAAAAYDVDDAYAAAAAYDAAAAAYDADDAYVTTYNAAYDANATHSATINFVTLAHQAMEGEN
jgi:hypothetical protein